MAQDYKYRVVCECGKAMRVKEKHIGRTGTCSKCGNSITVTRENIVPIDSDGTGSTQGTAGIPAATPPPASVEWEPGQVILDQYEVKGVLGKGGMGKVYLVHDRQWDMDLAVKAPLPESLKSQAQRENFVRECHTWMDLGLHAHIVTCHYVRVLDGIPRVFAEYVDGGSLKDWIDKGKLYEGNREEVLERILRMAIQFAWGLDYAHEKGLIHQDVKPANVMVTGDGLVRITDFGLANARALTEEDESAPQGVSILASFGGMTPAYCSPEQASNQAQSKAGVPREQLTKLTRRTDIYSWAVSVLEMFNGEVTWMGGPVARAALAPCTQGEAARESIPPLPPELAGQLARCLQVDVDKRPKNMREVAETLNVVYRAVLRRDFDAAPPEPPVELADMLNNKALSFLELGNEKEAAATWRKALQADPQHTESTYNLGLHEWRAYSGESALLFRRKAPCQSEGLRPLVPIDSARVFRANRSVATQVFQLLCWL